MKTSVAWTAAWAVLVVALIGTLIAHAVVVSEKVSDVGGDVRVLSSVNASANATRQLALPMARYGEDHIGIGPANVLHWAAANVGAMPDTLSSVYVTLAVLNDDGTPTTITFYEPVPSWVGRGDEFTLFFNFGPAGIRLYRTSPVVTFGYNRSGRDVFDNQPSGIAAGQWTVAVGYRVERHYE